VLTVDFDRLGVGTGHRLLDMGCGGGRHVFEAARRGATVVALDRSETELKDVRGTLGAMADAGELPDATPGCVVTGDALALPLPDASVDRIIAAEVLEHVPADEIAVAELVRVLRPGGRIAVTVPSFLPERVCWWLSSDYHDTPGGHVRIYTLDHLVTKLGRAGLHVEGHARTHALHSPYWWLKCAVGVSNDDHALVTRYHDFLVYDLTKRPAWTTNLDKALSPVLGKSLVIYAQKS